MGSEGAPMGTAVSKASAAPLALDYDAPGGGQGDRKTSTRRDGEEVFTRGDRARARAAAAQEDPGPLGLEAEDRAVTPRGHPPRGGGQTIFSIRPSLMARRR